MIKYLLLTILIAIIFYVGFGSFIEWLNMKKSNRFDKHR